MDARFQKDGLFGCLLVYVLVICIKLRLKQSNML